MNLSLQKNPPWIPELVATCNISKNRLVPRRCRSGHCEKRHIQNTWLWSSILVKTTLDLLRVKIWKTESLKNGLLKVFYSFGNSQKKLCPRVSLQSKFAYFFSKATYIS